MGNLSYNSKMKLPVIFPRKFREFFRERSSLRPTPLPVSVQVTAIVAESLRQSNACVQTFREHYVFYVRICSGIFVGFGSTVQLPGKNLTITCLAIPHRKSKNHIKFDRLINSKID